MAQKVGDVTLDGLTLPQAAHQDHYMAVSVELLTPLFHYLLPLERRPLFDRRGHQAWQSFVDINRTFAEAVSRSDAETRVVSIEDYPVALVGNELRALRKRALAPLLYFHHVSWCEPDYLSVLPTAAREALLQGLLAYDGVGFHSRRWARAFLACCERYIPDCVVDADGAAWRSHRTEVSVAPAPIDDALLAPRTPTESEQRWFDEIAATSDGRWNLVRVDRVDFAKNLLRGLLAWDRLLELRPDVVDSSMFLVVLTPVRLWVPEHRKHLSDCLATIDHINERFGSKRPVIQALVGDDSSAPDRDRSLAAMRNADAVLVNPIFDGLNLVAKEAVAVSDRDPLILLSRNAGVFDEIGHLTLPIDPFDVEGTAQALSQARDIDARERRARADQIRALLAANTPDAWFRRRLTPHV